EEVLRAVLAQGRLEEVGPGQTVFRQGDGGDRLYIVKSGVLEVVSSRDGGEPTPLAYLGEGEVVGELALLTGSPRSATVRCPQQAVVLTLDKAVFADLMDTLPAFARDLCIVLAKRLERAALNAPRPAAKQLQGNLRFFDLATVVQTLITAQQTGTLTVAQDDGRQKVADIFFFKGNVARAKYKHLTGDDAVFQLFQSPPEGEFSFAGKTVVEEEVHSDVTLPAISLLMESVRLQDELPLLRARVGDPRRRLRPRAVELQWSEPDSVELAAAVWARIRKGASAEDLERDIARCSYAIYGTLARMLEAGQIE
ncbi:MAG TPA: cyclic nucleotide-binding domain-containing protein, partial [Vicinamibacteria bacterium]|nr:cyclic nucleotide-binding domain-containing protein [Vicinamibacteria bacterium]